MPEDPTFWAKWIIFLKLVPAGVWARNTSNRLATYRDGSKLAQVSNRFRADRYPNRRMLKKTSIKSQISSQGSNWVIHYLPGLFDAMVAIHRPARDWGRNSKSGLIIFELISFATGGLKLFHGPLTYLRLNTGASAKIPCSLDDKSPVLSSDNFANAISEPCEWPIYHNLTLIIDIIQA